MPGDLLQRFYASPLLCGKRLVIRVDIRGLTGGLPYSSALVLTLFERRLTARADSFCRDRKSLLEVLGTSAMVTR